MNEEYTTSGGDNDKKDSNSDNNNNDNSKDDDTIPIINLGKRKHDEIDDDIDDSNIKPKKKYKKTDDNDIEKIMDNDMDMNDEIKIDTIDDTNIDDITTSNVNELLIIPKDPTNKNENNNDNTKPKPKSNTPTIISKYKFDKIKNELKNEQELNAKQMHEIKKLKKEMKNIKQCKTIELNKIKKLPNKNKSELFKELFNSFNNNQTKSIEIIKLIKNNAFILQNIWIMEKKKRINELNNEIRKEQNEYSNCIRYIVSQKNANISNAALDRFTEQFKNNKNCVNRKGILYYMFHYIFNINCYY